MLLSVVLATHNEQSNLGRCLSAIKELADEIIIVDGESTDDTVDIARQFKAKIISTTNKANFHLNKQIGLHHAKGIWILQLDADEVVSPQLASEIKTIIKLSSFQLKQYLRNHPPSALFIRHQQLVQDRDPVASSHGPVNGFYLPRLNYFLGRPLKHGGVYPDGVIRLVKKGYAHFPCQSVHEQIHVKGRVSWLQHDLIHHDSPTFSQYFHRFNRYTSLTAKNLKQSKVSFNLPSTFMYLVVKPTTTFINIYFRHKGFLDNFPGFIWALFSALHHPVAYIKYWELLHQHSPAKK